ncbi:hypothetical protein NB703_003011 [Pantoea ananatis]|uniref:Transposase n=1 Tax=Pantoea ananas TaxID=553 RepID=A0AAJ1D097_PANAN|nr:hypothetical protein [Pantoea ananatis]
MIRNNRLHVGCIFWQPADFSARTVKEVCREAAISEVSNYNWKAKYGGMEAADIKKIKDLGCDNRHLKQMFADLSLECRALKYVIEKIFKNSNKT